MSKRKLLTLLTLPVFAVAIFNDAFFPYYQLFVSLVFFIDGYVLLKEILRRRFVYRLRHIISLLITVVVLFITFILVNIPLLDKFIWLIFVDLAIPFLVAVCMFFISFPYEFYGDLTFVKTQKRIKKQHITSMLVLDNQNGLIPYAVKKIMTSIGSVAVVRNHHHDAVIAHEILVQIKETTRYLVVSVPPEKTDLAKVADLLEPAIIVLPKIKLPFDQDTISAIENLLKKGAKKAAVLIDAANRDTLTLSAKERKRTTVYSVSDSESDEHKDEIAVSALHIVPKRKHVTFSLIVQDKTIHFAAPVWTYEVMSSLIPSILIAKFLGMKVSEIKKAVASLERP